MKTKTHREELEELHRELLELLHALAHSPLPPRYTDTVRRVIEALKPQ